MPRTETDREDLMAEAVALVRRVELSLPDRDERVVCGFRRSGGFSAYVGPDAAYHFDAGLRLRRAFHDGKLYRTQGTTLSEMTRDRSDSTTTLVRRDLSPTKLLEFIGRMRSTLQTVQAAIAEGRATVERQVPHDDAGLLSDVGSVLAVIVHTEPALAPMIEGKP